MDKEQPKTAQGWAWNYLESRLEVILKLLTSTENLPKVTTFADLAEGELFIRFPVSRTEGDKLVFRNTELYRKIRSIRYSEGGSPYSAMRVISGSFHDIPDNEPAIVIK